MDPHMSNINLPDQMVQKLQLKMTEKFKLFGPCDIDIDPMTLVLILYLNVILTYFYTYGVYR